MRGDQPLNAVGPIRWGTGQTLTQHARQRIDICAIGDLIAGEPLRGHVVVGSHGGPGLGQPRVGGGTGNTEIDQIGEVARGDQNVFRFYVAVRYAVGMRGIQSGGDLAHDGHSSGRGQRTILFQ
ncbi:Uncharacterised protein [Mycobacterium tuberculosis]|uniref:Uncharacterized protein n=1 Tax=Mycobacterium tuberculosis TaxID=1773 RepID=A0A655HL93_MYCTX|nr:Uncharacterised protein [Mycobacterium tuberculosis]CFE46110.1 Uncharacterised protein [Mycobacterium tuberculosis]CKR29001.1 Uncharacterised protein [Mycobacterium tuberculosis]CKS66599.1 Uncharacterised protein [Mycobacterium tuberculosis]CNL82295.1 Uncharacterised protein [Mycobacterium tuberculosis]